MYLGLKTVVTGPSMLVVSSRVCCKVLHAAERYTMEIGRDQMISEGSPVNRSSEDVGSIAADFNTEHDLLHVNSYRSAGSFATSDDSPRLPFPLVVEKQSSVSATAVRSEMLEKGRIVAE
jgi:hypothetical protein